MERFFFAKRVRSVDSLEAAAEMVHSPDFRPSEEAIVEAPGERDRCSTRRRSASPRNLLRASCDSIADKERHARLSDRRRFLLSGMGGGSIRWKSNRAYPAWMTAFREREGAGRNAHTIDFQRLAPRTLYWSAGISAAALAGILILCLA